MRNIAIIFSVLISFSSTAQMTFELKGKVTKNISPSIKEGSVIELKEIYPASIDPAKVLVLVDYRYETISLKNLENISFSPSNLKEYWQNQEIRYSIYEDITKNGMQYDMRKELEDEAMEFINYTENSKLSFNDSYLENYIYTLIYRICPSRLDDGRPGILNVKIIKDNNPNVFIFTNGTLCISTGLISILNSEEELIAVLAHEISHFVLDHSVSNINQVNQRQKRAEFWAAFATVAAAAVDVYAASNNSNYTPGILTLSTGVLAFSVADVVKERMGLKFYQQQEMEADRCAVELMNYIGVNPKALASVLSKIKKYLILNGDYLALSGNGAYSAIESRIKQIGEPATFNDVDYDKIISFVNSFNAIAEYHSRHFASCAELLNRNIKSNLATEEDYVLLAMTYLSLYDTETNNLEALELIKTAKTLNVYPSINIFKQEALILIRLSRMNEAKISLDKYLSSLEKERSKLEVIKNIGQWTKANDFIDEECEWTAKMIYKVTKL